MLTGGYREFSPGFSNALQRYNIPLTQCPLIRTYGYLIMTYWYLIVPFWRFHSLEGLLLMIRSLASTHRKGCKRWF